LADAIRPAKSMYINASLTGWPKKHDSGRLFLIDKKTNRVAFCVHAPKLGLLKL